MAGNHTFWSQSDDYADVWVTEVDAAGAAAAGGGAAGVAVAANKVGWCRLTLSNPR